jgi:hypothetical protein
MNDKVKSAKSVAWKRYSHARTRQSYRKYAIHRNECTSITREAKKKKNIATEDRKHK